MRIMELHNAVGVSETQKWKNLMSFVLGVPGEGSEKKKKTLDIIAAKIARPGDWLARKEEIA